jgi:hypothetical protein
MDTIEDKISLNPSPGAHVEKVVDRKLTDAAVYEKADSRLGYLQALCSLLLSEPTFLDVVGGSSASSAP